MKKILLSSGHGGTDSGSIGADKLKEKDRNLALAKDLAYYLNTNYDVIVDVKTEKNTFGKWAIKNRIGYDYALAIHFNAFGQGANGTECLYKHSSANALKIASVTSLTLNIRNRGAKQRKDLYMLNIGFDNLIETCFHDNQNDLNAYNKNRAGFIRELAKTIASINGLALKMNAKKEATKKIQAELNAMGFRDMNGLVLVVDGIRGAKTDYAISKFREKNIYLETLLKVV